MMKRALFLAAFLVVLFMSPTSAKALGGNGLFGAGNKQQAAAPSNTIANVSAPPGTSVTVTANGGGGSPQQPAAQPAPAAPTSAATPAPAGKPAGAPATVVADPAKTKPTTTKPATKKGGRAPATMQCDGTATQKPGIAMVLGDPKWRSTQDGAVPTAPTCGVDEAAVVVGNTQYKYDQQCLDWQRGRAATDPNTWVKHNQLFAIAANVTQVGKEIRIWCVPADQVITQDRFGLLAKLAKQLKDIGAIDWDAVRELLRQAPDFVTKETVKSMIKAAGEGHTRLIKAVEEKVGRLESRVDNLEAMSTNFDIGFAGGYAHPGAVGGFLTMALNVPFAAASWSYRLEAGVGGGLANGQVSPAFMAATSFNRQFGRLSIGADLRFQIFQWKSTNLAALTIGPRLEIRLGGPDYTKLDPQEVRDRNGKFAVEPNLFVAGGIGGAVIPVPGNYRLAVTGQVVGGLLIRVGKRYPVRKSVSGEALAVLEQVQAEAAGEPFQQ